MLFIQGKLSYSVWKHIIPNSLGLLIKSFLKNRGLDNIMTDLIDILKQERKYITRALNILEKLTQKLL